jgi:hypothetical protein
MIFFGGGVKEIHHELTWLTFGSSHCPTTWPFHYNQTRQAKGKASSSFCILTDKQTLLGKVQGIQGKERGSI